MKGARDTLVRVEISLEELGRISIALDRLASGCDPVLDPEYIQLQQKWDDLYKAFHILRSKGVVGLS